MRRWDQERIPEGWLLVLRRRHTGEHIRRVETCKSCKFKGHRCSSRVCPNFSKWAATLAKKRADAARAASKAAAEFAKNGKRRRTI
mmetsp:Transcript_17428/g.61942  ORF Transcript_17428/g.61942 Transcript_17428/m.61942 type:complete len:86 (+) Transcript_17428:47-304(+)